MSVFKESVLALPAVVLLLLLSHALLGPDEHERSGQPMTIRLSWIGADPPPSERWLAKESIVTGGPEKGAGPPPGAYRFAKHATPGARIRGVFAQFVPGESDRAI
jgi:hypothetical protein